MRKLNFLQAVLIFLLILSVGFGSGYLILYYLAPQTAIGQLGTRVLILVVVGIGTGLVCRLAVPKRLWFLKSFFGVSGSLLSIAILDWFFPGSFVLLEKQSFPAVDWSAAEYTQIACLLVIALLIALLGKKRTAVPQPEVQRVEPKKAVQKAAPSRSASKLSVKSKTKLPAVKLNTTAKKTTAKKNSSKKTVSKPTVKKTTTAVKVKAAKKSTTTRKKTTAAKTKKRSKNNNVTLTGTEEHRCPYCLEIVNKNDPRGVVVCPDCGTWHHKDCWDITGSCQVAHKHKL